MRRRRRRRRRSARAGARAKPQHGGVKSDGGAGRLRLKGGGPSARGCAGPGARVEPGGRLGTPRGAGGVGSTDGLTAVRAPQGVEERERAAAAAAAAATAATAAAASAARRRAEQCVGEGLRVQRTMTRR